MAARAEIKVFALPTAVVTVLLLLPLLEPTAPTANDVEEQRALLWLDFPAVSGCEDMTDPSGDAAADKETD